MTAEILCVGTEILLGDIVNTNATYLSRKLAEHGISCEGKRARQLRAADYSRFDLLIGMDDWNLRNMKAICGGDPEGKILRLMDLTDRPGEVSDPWYTGDFESTWRDVSCGCRALLQRIATK